MKKLFIAGLTTSILTLLATYLSSSAYAQELKFQEYTVKKGDTCTSIAKQFYGDPHAYDNIHNYNDLSSTNYACVPGQVLKLPIIPEKPEAELTSRHGQVRAKSPKIDWKSVDVGAAFYPAWKVNTLASSSAELGFRNETKLAMDSNTLVVIYGPDKDRTSIQTITRATVERGRLRTFLSNLPGAAGSTEGEAGNEGPLQVSTPAAKATMTTGSQQISVDETDGESRFANHVGAPMSVESPDGRGKVIVKQGFGARVKKNQLPEKPRKLPDPPQWSTNIVTKGLVIGNGKTDLNASWLTMKDVEGYRVELSHDERQLDLVFSQNVPANVTQVALKQLPAGEYYLSVVSIDSTKFESAPSKLLKLKVYSTNIAKNQRIPDMDESNILLGSTFYPPKGLTCSIQGEKDLTVRSKKDSTITCDASGTPISANFDVISPSFKLNQGETINLYTTGSVSELIDFSPMTAEDLKITSPSGIETKQVKVSPTQYRVNVSTHKVTPGDYALELKTFDTSLGTIPLHITNPPKPKVKETQEQEYPRFYNDVLATFSMPASSAPNHYGAATLEILFGIHANKYVAAEISGGYGAIIEPKFTFKRRQLVTARGLFLFGYPPLDNLTLYLNIGGTWKGLFLDSFETRLYVTGGFAAIRELYNHLIYLRLDGDVSVAPLKDSLEIIPEARLGVHIVF